MTSRNTESGYMKSCAVAQLSGQIEEATATLERAERDGNLQAAGQIKFVRIPELQKQLAEAEKALVERNNEQRLLETEGVRFDKTGRCDLQTFLWIPKDQGPAEEASRKGASLFKRKSSPKETKR